MPKTDEDDRLGYVDYQNMTMLDFGYKYYDWRFYSKRDKVDPNDEVEVKAWLISKGFVDDVTIADRKKGQQSKWWDEQDMKRIKREVERGNYG